MSMRAEAPLSGSEPAWPQRQERVSLRHQQHDTMRDAGVELALALDTNAWRAISRIRATAGGAALLALDMLSCSERCP